jgi:hypothetical protein
MKFYKVGTEVRVLGDWGYGTRVKHGIVTSHYACRYPSIRKPV